MDGSLPATDSWFANPASQVSAHTGVGLNGERHGYVGYGSRAWANGIKEPGNRWARIGQTGNPNDWTLSIETEDLGLATEPVTDLEYAAVKAECIAMMAQYASIKWLIGHDDISPSSRPHCPGDRWRASDRFMVLAGALGLKTL